MDNICSKCGAPISGNNTACEYCGFVLKTTTPQQPQRQQPQQPQTVYQQTIYQQVGNPAIDQRWPIKSKVTAGVLGILLGGIGIHKFYLGKVGMGILYLLLCWTYVPAIIGLIEGIVYLASNDENFQLKHKVRLR